MTGNSKGNGTNTDYATVAYDSNGNELWVARFDGLGSYNDRVYDLAVGPSGNVYVTGDSRGANNWNDYLTVAYDPNGNELWTARYSGSGTSANSAKAIATDPAGNIYVTGYTYNINIPEDNCTLPEDCPPGSICLITCSIPIGFDEPTDYATVAYDPDGNELWSAIYDSTEGYNDKAADIAVDSSGNVYVTGWSDTEYSGGGLVVMGNTDSDYATVAYDQEGNERWVARYSGGDESDRPSAIATGPSGNIYVTGSINIQGGASICQIYPDGSSSCPSPIDYATVAYDPDGNELWTAIYDSTEGYNDRASDITVDSSGNVYVTGGNTDYATIKYASLYIECSSDSDCFESQYCERPEGMCTDTGLCTKTPEDCPISSNPLCGCNGTTYGNSCMAAQAGVSIDHEGQCDTDGDGIPDDADFCPDTIIPEENVPSKYLGVHRYALMDDDTEFDTRQRNKSKRKNPLPSFTLEDTAGCSCEQILDTFPRQHKGQIKYGCSSGLMRHWIRSLPSD